MLLHEIEILSSDPEKSKAFYQEILGLNVLTENKRLKVFDSGHPGLDLNASNHHNQKLSLSFLVKDINSFMRNLEQNGIPYKEPVIAHLGLYEIILEDPDGNRIAIHSPGDESPDWMKSILWGEEIGAYKEMMILIWILISV